MSFQEDRVLVENVVLQQVTLKKHTLDLFISPGKLFILNAVSRLFYKVVRIDEADTVFDIGTGDPVAFGQGASQGLADGLERSYFRSDSANLKHGSTTVSGGACPRVRVHDTLQPRAALLRIAPINATPSIAANMLATCKNPKPFRFGTLRASSLFRVGCY